MMTTHDATEKAYKNGYEKGEWEMFSLVTSTWYGKEYYFRNDDGTVYSRLTHKDMSMDEAVKEFLDAIGDNYD